MCENLKKIHKAVDKQTNKLTNKQTDGQTPTITQPPWRAEVKIVQLENYTGGVYERNMWIED